MNYSSEEKQAINYFLVKLMKTDGTTDFSEAITLAEICRITQVSLNQVDASMQLSPEESKGIIKKMDAEKRLQVLALLKKMGQIDGHFDQVQKDIIVEVFS